MIVGLKQSRIFFLLGASNERQVLCAAHRIIFGVFAWWETIKYSLDIQTMTWDVFEILFKENYFNTDHRQSVADEFEALYWGSMIVTDYYKQYLEL